MAGEEDSSAMGVYSSVTSFGNGVMNDFTESKILCPRNQKLQF